MTVGTRFIYCDIFHVTVQFNSFSSSKFSLSIIFPVFLIYHLFLMTLSNYGSFLKILVLGPFFHWTVVFIIWSSPILKHYYFHWLFHCPCSPKTLSKVCIFEAFETSESFKILLKGQRGMASVLSCPEALLFVRCSDTYNNKHELWTLNTFTALFISQGLQQTLRNKYTFMGKHYQGPLV